MVGRDAWREVGEKQKKNGEILSVVVPLDRDICFLSSLLV